MVEDPPIAGSMALQAANRLRTAYRLLSQSALGAQRARQRRRFAQALRLAQPVATQERHPLSSGRISKGFG